MANMNNATSGADNSSNNGGRDFPEEAYKYNEDVTKEAVDQLRKAANIDLSTDEWEVIDGFGQVIWA